MVVFMAILDANTEDYRNERRGIDRAHVVEMGRNTLSFIDRLIVIDRRRTEVELVSTSECAPNLFGAIFRRFKTHFRRIKTAGMMMLI